MQEDTHIGGAGSIGCGATVTHWRTGSSFYTPSVMSDSQHLNVSAAPQTVQPTVHEVCSAVIKSVSTKADKNKRRARWSGTTLTAVTAGIPVSIIFAGWFSDNSFWAFFLGRLLPGVLAAADAILSRWIQIEQPHQRWTLYRHWQRVFEAERLRYQQKIGRYSAEAPDAAFAEFIAQAQLDLDDQWASLIPRSRDVATEQSERKWPRN